MPLEAMKCEPICMRIGLYVRLKLKEYLQVVTGSTGTVHTSAKARLSWLSVVSRWRNDVIVAMAMPASLYTALQCRAAQSVDTTFRIFQY